MKIPPIKVSFSYIKEDARIEDLSIKKELKTGNKKKERKEGEIERAIYRPINGIANCKKSTTSVKVNIPDGDV